MAGDNIKGLTAKIGADTADFMRGMKQADRQINETVKTADKLTEALKVKFDDKTFTAAQKNATNALEMTRAKAERVKEQLAALEKAGKVDTADYQRLERELAKTEASAVLLEKKLKDINKTKLTAISQEIDKVAAAATRAGKAMLGISAAAAAALFGMYKLASGAAKTGDEILKASRQFGLSTDAIQALNYAAMQSSVSADVLYRSYNRARQLLGKELVEGSDNANKALQALGISIQNYSSQEEAFYGIIDALAGIENETMQAYYANEIFGNKIGSEIIPLLKQGQGAIREYGEEFAAIGGMSREQVEQLAEMQTELNKLTTEFEKAKNELAIAFLPVLLVFAEILRDFIIPMIKMLTDFFSSLPDPIQKAIIVVLLLTAVLAPLLLIGGKLIAMWGAMTKIIPIVTALIKGKATAAQSATAAFILLAGAMMLGLDLITNWKEMSTVEKVLKSLAAVLMIAAAAWVIFHASWSLGIKVAVIAAAVAAGIAMIASAAKSAKIDTDISESSTGAAGVTGAGGGFGDQELTGGGMGGNVDNSVTQGDTIITINIYDADSKNTDEIISEINAYFTAKKLGYR